MAQIYPKFEIIMLGIWEIGEKADFMHFWHQDILLPEKDAPWVSLRYLTKYVWYSVKRMFDVHYFKGKVLSVL